MREFKSIKKFLKDKPLKFLEIGAGCGRTAHVVLQNTKILNYTIIDLPSTLRLSSQYLKEVLSEEQFYRIVFVSTDTLNTEESLNKFMIKNQGFDWALNIDSFAEMDIKTVESYLSLIDLSAEFAYIKNPVGK